MKTSHTPGPWLAYNWDNGRPLKHWRIRGAAVRNDPTFAVIDSGGKISPEYEAANARLIASAPELLEALRVIAAWDPAAAPGEPGGMSIIDAIDTAQAAIAKAEGTSEEPTR